jgi:hypothetical protein
MTNMKKLITFLLLLTAVSNATAQLVSGEYFIDSAPAVGSGTAFSFASANAVNQTINVPTTGLSSGFHNVFIRVRDNVSRWSHFEGRTFYLIPPAVFNSQATLTAAEYFVDTDPGVGLGTAVPITSGNSVNTVINVPISTLTSGFHNIFIRVKNADNVWSLHEGRTFYIIPVAAGAQPQLNAAEYFVDTDPGVGLGTAIPVTAGNAINTVANIPITGLTSGFHNVFIRVRNANNVWSLYEGRTFYIIPVATSTTQPLLTAAEWFIDTDPGIGNGTAISFAPTATLSQAVNIALPVLPIGVHHLFIRVKNADNVWSLYEGRSFTTSTLGILTNELQNIRIYPNPATQILNIRLDDNTAIERLIITDLSGKKILEQNGNATTVNIENLATGMYVIEVVAGGAKMVSKFIKN